ncbi:unnamed protein product [Microthlaspi erraticum]|uniref:Uncharacterized protein n=1 Tax=Microthlaspi erraticum TaxID=1685480 RepID=A0A6D2K9I4_9BRAS|nr:unnamed protein product [Microthlaspi erraticum]
MHQKSLATERTPWKVRRKQRLLQKGIEAIYREAMTCGANLLPSACSECAKLQRIKNETESAASDLSKGKTESLAAIRRLLYLLEEEEDKRILEEEEDKWKLEEKEMEKKRKLEEKEIDKKRPSEENEMDKKRKVREDVINSVINDYQVFYIPTEG